MNPTACRFALLLVSALALITSPRLASVIDDKAPGAAKPAPAVARPQTAGARFEVTIDPGLGDGPITGRLIVLTIAQGAKVPEGSKPIDGPFWSDPQPLFGIDVKAAKPGAAVVLDQGSEGFPCLVSELPPGKYVAQARLDTQRESSQWEDQPGNLFGAPVSFEVRAAGEPTIVRLTLDKKTSRRERPLPPGVQVVEVTSKSLSQTFLKPMMLRASVIPPIDMQPGRKYPAVYEVPGFGGDHLDGLNRRVLQRSNAEPTSPEGRLARAAFLIILDPESKNGHTLFVDSFNNGDRGRALIAELIPAIEAAHPLIAEPSARLLRGHSSGGWSVLWLMLNYSSTFGFAWSSSPDPVDFRSLQGVNIYEDENMYVDAAGAERPSFVQGGKTLMTIRQETGGEDIIGPDNTSAQQWDSWFATWGPRNARGNPAELFDPRTGVVNRLTASRYRSFDIGLKFREDARRFGPILRDRCRVVVGTADEFGLDKAVALLKTDLDAWVKVNPAPAENKTASLAGIQIVEGKTHGSIFQTPEIFAFPTQMLEYLKAHGHVP
ncbi:MAG: hypothetical protein K2W85_10165 [Phycisphaerales bacterium]|nr:hypothetical protein [Phycisphaerales bacterium]